MKTFALFFVFAAVSIAQAPARAPGRGAPKIVNSLADVPAQAAGTVTVSLDAAGMTALLAAATAGGYPDTTSYLTALVQREVSAAQMRYHTAEIYAQEITMRQKLGQQIAASTAAVKVTGPPPAKTTTPAKK